MKDIPKRPIPPPVDLMDLNLLDWFGFLLVVSLIIAFSSCKTHYKTLYNPYTVEEILNMDYRDSLIITETKDSIIITKIKKQ